MSAMDIFRIIGKHIITMIISFIVVFGISCVYLVTSKPVYSATSQTYATYGDASIAPDNYTSLSTASSYISTQIKSFPSLIKTTLVLDPAAQKLGIPTSMLNSVTAVNPDGTSFINITATSNSAQQAADIANTVAESFQTVVQTSLYMHEQQSPIKITMVQPASAPSKPTSPKSAMVLAIGVIGGLVVGVLAALIKHLFSREIQDETELSDYISAPVLGRIPETDDIAGNTSVIINAPSSPEAEEYRRICMNLSFIAPVSGTNSRLIVVSAVGANEGKTTTAVNIATALAENGAKVLLIDADLRHPSVAKKLDIDGSAGLAHVLSDQASVRDVVQPYWKPNLHVMPAGPKPPNAGQLLNSPLMTELIAQALHQYDYVIVDTTPMVVASDAALFAKQGGGLVLVSRRGLTLKKQLAETAQLVKNLNVEVTGFVFNCIKDDSRKSLYGSSYYYYGGSNARGKQHHDDQPKHGSTKR
ncbi:polysaccharide biosynthesis tyrosine autokinase [Bifidobacterium dolichotidis]|nr:polysaccharide biosynthesis tyrosine autokinase [Bifidobacterium dolichotidis]